MSNPRQAALAPELAPDGVAWCAVNFAYLMAEDVRRALLDVEGIRLKARPPSRRHSAAPAAKWQSVPTCQHCAGLRGRRAAT